MGYTISEKIMARASGNEQVHADDIVWVDIDRAMMDDVLGPRLEIDDRLREMGVDVWDPDKVVIVSDHYTPPANLHQANIVKFTREWAAEHKISRYYEFAGPCHQVMVEHGHVLPGSVVVGTDSHTCTYGALASFATGVGSTDMAAGMVTGKAWFKVPSALKFELVGKPNGWVSGKDVILHIIGMIGVDGALYKSMEFTGDGIKNLTMDDRFTICNMAIEAGGKNGIFPVDDLAVQYMKDHSKRDFTVYEADPDAEYDEVYTIDLSELKPTVAFPHLPENTKTIGSFGDIPVDQSVIGSCTNGRIDDMRIAARVMKGRKVAKNVRCIVIPATQEIYLQAMREGLLEIFIEAGAIVSTPTCGPCLGGYMGILAAGERCISTTNRNFVGRMGHVDSEVYLASPAIAAASAITGKISAPEELGL